MGKSFVIEDNWPRICGIHIQKDGQVAAVWIAHDKDADCVHVYDCHLHEREVIAVQAETIKRRGKWIPVTWPEDGKEIVDRLYEHGVNTIPEPVKNTDRVAEAVALELWERMVTGRFKANASLEDWRAEYQTYQREEGGVPMESHPLMSATRHAVSMLEWARCKPSKTKLNYPKVAIV